MFGTRKTRILALSVGLAAVSVFAAAQATAPANHAAPAGSASAASSPATPAPALASGPSKVGIVNIQDAIVATNEGKKEFDTLQAKFAPKQAELKTLNDEVEGLKKELQAQGDKLSEDARTTKLKTLDSKQKLLQRNYDDAQSEFQQAEQEVVNRIGGKMLNVLEKYAKANGYSVILDVSNPQTPVLWAGDGTIITKQLVDAYNAESPVAAPAAPAPKPAGSATRPPASSTATPKKP